MSELISTQNAERGFRRRLLTSVSALAILASVAMRDAKAADGDADRPTVWIELGGEMDHITGQGDAFTPGFLSVYPTSSVLQKPSPIEAQNPPPFSFGGEGKISFQPRDTNWVFAASVRFGRSSNNRGVHHQTTGVHHYRYIGGIPTTSEPVETQEKFFDAQVAHRESHAIMDFQVGRDVGLGMFGNAASVLSAGVRIAQFSSKASVDMRARPDLNFFQLHYRTNHELQFPYFHTYHATSQASRSFHGIGPSLSWDGSAPFVGNPHNGELTFDWGANAAVLFGRQKSHVQDLATGHYRSRFATSATTPYVLIYQHPGGHDSVRSVIVPNTGGMAGASYRIDNVKVSVGYRADLFFNAMDVGIDARKSATLGFYGPFASVSVGIGG